MGLWWWWGGGRKLQNISEKVIGPHADKNSLAFAVTMYTIVDVITLPAKPLFVVSPPPPPPLPPPTAATAALLHDYVLLPALSAREVRCGAD